MRRLIGSALLVLTVVVLQWWSSGSQNRSPQTAPHMTAEIQSAELPSSSPSPNSIPTTDFKAQVDATPQTSAINVTDHSLSHTVAYLKERNTLPAYYLTKKEATAKGWIPSKGNLAVALPDMMIGGDIFTNAERQLPRAPGRVWREADFEYTNGTRNAKRILYSNDGLIFVTYDHYKTFKQY